MESVEYSLANIDRVVGRELAPSEWISVDQSRIDAFSACTGDHQWIHVDAERARRDSPYGTTIAHGYLTLSMVAPIVAQSGLVPRDAKAALNYGLDKVRFLAPVKAGARVRGRLRIVSAEPHSSGATVIKVECTLDIEHEPKPALVAEVLCLLLG